MKPSRTLVTLLSVLTLLALAAAPAALAQSGGLVAAYGFEEPSGTAAVDSSGAGNAGTLAGPTRSASGRFGAALSFDGTNDRVNVADSASLDLTVGMTLEAWVRPNGSNWRTAVLKERPGGLAYALYSSSDNNRPMGEIAASNGGETRGTAALPSATWSHLATTYDGATLRLFVNGTQVSSRAISGPIAVSSGALRIGGNAVWGEYFNGLIDEVRVYNRALTAGEIQLDMGRAVVASDTQPPTAPSLTASVTSDDVQLSWTAATDDVGVTRYRVYRDGAQLGIGTTNRASTDYNRPVGTYRYKVVAVDDAGNVSADSNEAEATVEPDTTPPSVTSVATCNGATVADWITLRPTFSDDRGPVTATVKVDGEVVYGPRDVGGPSGSFFFDWETRNHANGPHVMTVLARDAAGNESVSEPCDWNVHNPEVTIPITSHADGDTISGNVKFTADVLGDGQPLIRSGLRVYWSITPAGAEPGTGYLDSGRPFEFDFNSGTVPDGLYNLRVTTNWHLYIEPLASNTIQVRVHNAPPAPTGVRTEVHDDDVDVLWDPIDDVSTYHVYRDGNRIGTTSGTAFTDSNRPNGTYRYTVTGQRFNAEGPASEEASATVAVVGDTTPPTIDLNAACDGRALREYVGPINGTASDDRPGNLTVTVDVEDERVFGPASTSGSFSFSWDTRKHPNGPVTMKVTARDAAGNETVKNCPWTVDNPTLTVPITGPADGDTVSGNVTIGFRPAANDVPTTAPAALYIDGAQVWSTGTGPWTFDWDTTRVADGLHTIRADLVFWQGYNQVMATSTIQLRVDNPDAPPPPSGLVAAYGFEHTSGSTATDSSGKGSTGTIAGATSVTGGKFGRALSFDGAGDMVTAADSNALDLTPGMTLSAWVKPATAGDWRTVILKERPGQLAYALYASTDDGRPMTEVLASSQRDARGTAALPVGVWSHLAATYDGTTLWLFVNGTQVATTALSGAFANSIGALRIGGNSVWGEWFSGLIDEVRVYERALSAPEIQADADRAVVSGT